MNIELLIAKSLFESGKVSVPSLGTFTVHDHSARLVKTGQVTFIPPQKIATFLPDSQVEDSTFILYIAQKNNCTETEAQNIVSAYVLQCNMLLQTNGNFAIDGVGVVHNDWTFDSKVSPEANPEFFGLTDFSIDKLSEAEKKNDREKPLRVTKNAVKMFFIASPILFGALLIPNVLQVSQNVELASLFRQTAATIDSSKPELPRPYVYVAPAEIEPVFTETQEEYYSGDVEESYAEDDDEEYFAETSDDVPQEVTEECTVVEKPVVEKTQKIQKQAIATKYFVIVGTFSVKENAEKYSKKLQSQRYDSGVIADNDKNRVYLSVFSDKAEADQYLEKLHGSEYSKAWLLVKNS